MVEIRKAITIGYHSTSLFVWVCNIWLAVSLSYRYIALKGSKFAYYETKEVGVCTGLIVCSGMIF